MFKQKTNMFRGVENKVLKASEITMKNLVEDVKRYCPVDSGELKNSISLTSNSDKISLTVDAPHAEAVEYGTKNVKAQPFVRPAIKMNENKIKKEFEDIL